MYIYKLKFVTTSVCEGSRTLACLDAVYPPKADSA